MTEIDDLSRRLGAVEHLLGMEHRPPLDRLSTIDSRLDSLPLWMQQQRLAFGELVDDVNRVAAHLQGHDHRFDWLDTDMIEAKAGIANILRLLQETA